jgi:glutathione peroxidase
MEAAMSRLETIRINDIQGKETSLGAFAGKVRLVVNVASKCGLTPQYAGLEELYRRFRDRGLEVLGFPANDFAGQEPGTDEEIAAFCRTSYDIDFPMFSKIVVTGQGKHPLYAELTAAIPVASGDGEAFRKRLEGFGIRTAEAPEVLWNFEKFVIDRSGEVIARFSPNTAPDDPALAAVIETALAK